MNYREKAKELVDKFSNIVLGEDGKGNDYKLGQDSLIEAKQCASITVDEILSALHITTDHCSLRKLDYQEVQSDFDYWKRVKDEIQEL